MAVLAAAAVAEAGQTDCLRFVAVVEVGQTDCLHSAVVAEAGQIDRQVAAAVAVAEELPTRRRDFALVVQRPVVAVIDQTILRRAHWYSRIAFPSSFLAGPGSQRATWRREREGPRLW